MIALNRDKVRRVVCGVDWGYTHPGTLEVFALDGEDRMYRVYEVYRSGKTIDWWVERGREIHAFYRVERFLCDPSEPAYITAFQRAGLPAEPAYNGVAPGIQAVQQRLVKQADGLPRLFFLRNEGFGPDPAQLEKKLPVCLEDEVTAYVWDTAANRKKGEEPLKVNDHGMDSLRYAVCYVDGVGVNRYRPVSPPAPAMELPKLW